MIFKIEVGSSDIFGDEGIGIVLKRYTFARQFDFVDCWV
jgi:hypothetical protein